MTEINKETKMNIENTSWTLEKLIECKSIISKPKFQRNQKWTILPTKKNTSNYKEYINFLIDNKNSVFPISLGTEIKDDKETYIVIDGNNRINAILTFLENPYIIFKEYYITLMKLIEENIDDISIKNDCIEIIKTLNYNTIASFRRLNDIFKGKINIDLVVFEMIEKALIEIQKKFLFENNLQFNTNIRLNVNIFKYGEYHEYCKIFEDINKHTNSLSNNELLSAILVNTNIVITDVQLKHKIIDKIKLFYDTRGNNEALQKYEMILDYNININAFDFIVGFQNYCSEKYSVIHEFDTSGLSLFFKLFKSLYKSIDICKVKDVYKNENIKEFIEDVEYSCNILNLAYSSIFHENIDETIFNKSAIKNKLLIKKNPMLIILISNIANKKQNVKIDKKNLINDNKKCIIYHFLSNKKYLKDVSDKDLASINDEDKIEYKDGGSFIDNMCNNILYKDSRKIFNISKEKFENLLKKNLKSHINENTHEVERKKNKRRKLNLLDKILIANYWNRNIPNKLIDNRYSMEHIIPYSSLWEGKIDIDRLGNIFPTLEEINSKRSNKSLSIYKDEYPIFYEVVKSLLQTDKYFNIISYENKKNNIKAIDNYNTMCKKNEELYMFDLIKELYN